MSSTVGRSSAVSSKVSTLQPNGPTVQVEFGGQKVDVPKGGYYDRYRMNPNLDEVARDPIIRPNLNFFRKILKKLVDSKIAHLPRPIKPHKV